MEDRLCGVHVNRMKDCFCWDCQAVVCSYCLEEHGSVLHKVFRLTSSALVPLMLDGLAPAHEDEKEKEKEKEKEREKEREKEANNVHIPEPLLEAVEMKLKPPEKPEEKKKPEPAPALCALCAAAESAGRNMIVLACTHPLHQDCLKQYVPS